MKKGLAFLLIGLLAVWILPATSEAVSTETAKLSPNPIELGYDDGIPGPNRDPGPDYITYDSGNPDLLNTGTDYWSRVTFTPNARFELQAIRFMPLNQGPNDEPCQVLVYTEDQDNHDLVEVAWETELDELEPWNMQDFDANWHMVEIPEDEFVMFEAGEHFSIIYGPAPGGVYNNPRQGDGWWNLFDGASIVDRSFLLNRLDEEHRNWGLLRGDLLLRANGEYQGNFIDLGVVEVYNDAEQWMMYPGTEQTFIADIGNYGDDVDAYVVNFQVLDPEGEAVFNQDVVGQDIESGDTTAIECDEVWAAGEALGLYNVVVTVLAGDDSNEDNNQNSMDQIVFNPDPENGDPDMWIGYVDDQMDGATNWNTDSGWCTIFHHPGGDQPLWITSLRVAVSADDVTECDFGINRLDMVQRMFEPIWEGTAETTDEGDQWVEIELEEGEYVTINENEALMVTYFFAEGVPIQIDGTPPFAGTNATMPWAMMQTGDDGDNYYWGDTGDFPIEIKIGLSDERPEGAHMRVEPEVLDFGESLATGVDHTIEAMFISFGDTTLEVTDIRLSPSATDYFTLSQSEFEVEAGDTGYVEVTFHSDTTMEFETQFLVANNSVNEPNFLWRVSASTLSILENIRPGIPGEYYLSQNHPNPFNPSTTIEFALTKAGDVQFDVFDMNGKLVMESYEGRLSAGYHSMEIDASGMPAGVYMYRLTSNEFSSMKKMILLK